MSCTSQARAAAPSCQPPHPMLSHRAGQEWCEVHGGVWRDPRSLHLLQHRRGSCEVSLIASLSHILWVLCLKSVLVQAAGQVSLASWSVASATPSPGWDTLGVPRLLQTLVALGTCLFGQVRVCQPLCFHLSLLNLFCGHILCLCSSSQACEGKADEAQILWR